MNLPKIILYQLGQTHILCMISVPWAFSLENIWEAFSSTLKTLWELHLFMARALVYPCLSSFSLCNSDFLDFHISWSHWCSTLFLVISNPKLVQFNPHPPLCLTLVVVESAIFPIKWRVETVLEMIDWYKYNFSLNVIFAPLDGASCDCSTLLSYFFQLIFIAVLILDY